jgi:putative transposase
MRLRKKHKTKSEKLAILKEASTQGVRATIEKYGIYPATYYSWRKKFDSMGDVGLEHSMTKERIEKIKCLEQ